MSASPIHSTEDPRAWQLAGLFLGCITAFSAFAHESHPDEEVPVFSLGVGVQAATANNTWPAPRLPGVLEAGNPREDERDGRLSYVELGLEMPLPGQHLGQLRFSQHGKQADPEVESAWITGETLVDIHRMRYTLGRQLLPVGLENQIDSHHREFAIAPIALRGVLNDSWRGDGVRVDLELPAGFEMGMGIWINDGFPGAPSDKPEVATLRLGWTGGEWQAEAGYVYADVDGRGLMTTGVSGHTHSLPSCDQVDPNRVCYSGKTQVANLAIRWRPEDRPWWVGGEWLFKRDDGALDSFFGQPDYRGDFNGGWLNFGWKVSPGLDVLFRAERAIASHNISGVNASLVAGQAGIANADRSLSAYGVSLAWHPAKDHFIGLEWQRELIRSQDNVFLVRYQYHFDQPLRTSRQ
jgi:hypothetical protein